MSRGLNSDGRGISVSGRGVDVGPVSAIPSSAVAQYDATEAASTGGITSIPDQIGSFDLSGNCSVISSGIDGKQSFRFDGTDDAMANTSTVASTEKWAVIMVVQQQEATGSAGLYYDTENNTLEATLQDNGKSNAYRTFRGDSNSDASDSAETNPVILSHIFENTDDIRLRKNGNQIDDNSLSTGDLNGFVLAARATRGSDFYLEADYGEVVILEDYASGDVTDEESRLSSKWGIAI